MKRGEKSFYFDYAGVPYPQGLTGNELAYFNHDAIRALLFIGCNDSDNQAIVEALNAYLDKKTDLIRCTPEEWDDSDNS